MKRWFIVIIICLAFMGGYGFSFAVQYYQSNKKMSLEEIAPSEETKESSWDDHRRPYTTLAFKVNLLNQNQEKIGVGYVPMYKIEEIQSLENREKYVSIIPTVDVEIFTNLPITDEDKKYSSYCTELIPWRKDRDQARFIT